MSFFQTDYKTIGYESGEADPAYESLHSQSRLHQIRSGSSLARLLYSLDEANF
jgi:hypothetical protein